MAPSPAQAAAAPGAAIRSLLRELDKTVRAHHLYDDANPTYQRFLAALRSAFEAVWTGVDLLEIRVDEDCIAWNRETVYDVSDRAESLAFLLHKDGIRGLRFLPGFERRELTEFLDVLERVRHHRGEGDDLVTLLWERDLEALQYSTAELFTHGVELPEPSSDVSFDLLQVRRLVLEEESGAEAGVSLARTGKLAATDEASEVWNRSGGGRDGLHPTLHHLEPAELERLNEQIGEETHRDVRHDTAAALLDILEADPVGRAATVRCLGILIRDALDDGHVVNAVYALDALSELAGTDGFLDDEAATAVTDILEGASAADVVEPLIEQLGDGARVGEQAFERLARHFGGSALGALLRGAADAPSERVERLLDQAVTSVAARSPRALVGLLEEDDPAVLVRVLRAMEHVELPDMRRHLERALRLPYPAARVACVHTLCALATPDAGDILVRSLGDVDVDVRVAAARGLAALRYEPATEALATELASKRMRTADLSEKRAYAEAYASVAGARGVELLGAILNGRSLFGRAEPAELRACVASGLGLVATPAAREALVKARGDRDPLVRHAVDHAIRGSA